MKTLSNVTLVLVSGIHNPLDLKSLMISQRGISFYDCLLLSEGEPQKTQGIRHIPIPPMSYDGYNKFILFDLNSYIHSDFCLVVQSDGFVTNPESWSDDFLLYDYIGASWTREMVESSRWVDASVKRSGEYSLVGNGGFSLRSKRLLQETSKCHIPCSGPEDAYICINNFNHFKDRIKFAPVEVADRFSKEVKWGLKDTFGFHGNKTIIHNIQI